MVFAWIGCGEPTDRPEDCTANEFFDETRRLCVTCPAIVAPTCDEGCGFEIVQDQNGCPAATCLSGEGCDMCDPLSFFDGESLMCEPCDGPTTCGEEGAEPEKSIVDGSCVLRCP